MMMARKLITLLMLILTPHLALALDSVSVTPSTAFVQGTGAALVTLRWTLEVTNSTTNPVTVTVTSSGGTLIAGAQPAVPTGGVLTRTVRLNPGTHFVRITERLRIDRTSARHILEAGTGTFQRTFTDSISSVALVTSVALQGQASGSGGLSIRNFDLSFDDGAAFRTVSQGEALTAQVSVTTSGRGVIDGKWEIAGPSGGFRVLKRVRLPAGGPTRTELESPLLPTDRAGQFRLRFVVDGDGDGSGDPVITYVVGSGAGSAAITLTKPADGADLASTTTFAWKAVAGATRYRIEFLAEGGAKPLAAVETTKATAAVKSFTLDRLMTGKPLVWRVVALDAGGQVVATSAARRIGAP
jgi:hypothetical protein